MRSKAPSRPKSYAPSWPGSDRWGKYEYSVIRQHGLWWRDLQFLVDQVERNRVRAWVWSDYVWNHPEGYYRLMPRSVLQSNWHYRTDFEPDAPRVKEYLTLDRHGFEQVPTVSNWYTPDNIPMAVEFCRKHLSKDRLRGFLLTPWRPTLPETRQRHFEAIDTFATAVADL